MGLGFVPIPLLDLAGLTALQLEMIYALCKAHNIPFKAQSVKSVISAFGGGALSVVGAPLLSSLTKFVPVVGFTASVAAGCIAGASTTYALGCVFDRHFRKGGTLGNFEPEKAKEYFAAKIDEGKEIAQKYLKKKKSDTTDPAAEASA